MSQLSGIIVLCIQGEQNHDAVSNMQDAFHRPMPECIDACAEKKICTDTPYDVGVWGKKEVLLPLVLWKPCEVPCETWASGAGY